MWEEGISEEAGWDESNEEETDNNRCTLSEDIVLNMGIIDFEKPNNEQNGQQMEDIIQELGQKEGSQRMGSSTRETDDG